jgi:membrane fusion protein (multidrug efflux system)
MKTKILILLFSILILSCGKGDKIAQLNKLKKDHDKLTEQIKSLELELTKEGNKGVTSERIINVLATELKEMPFSHYVEVQGKLDGDENVAVSAQTIGIVKNVYAKEGDYVKKGQILAQVDDAVAIQTLQEMESQLGFIVSLYDKQKSLWDQKIGSEVQYLSAKNNKEAMENRISTLKNQIETMKLKSPIDGSIEEVTIRVGQAVSPGFTFFRIVNFTRVKVVADVSENYSALIKLGDEVILYFPDIDHSVKANIDFTSKYISPINRTFAIQIRFNPDKYEYRANMIAVIKIRNHYSAKAISVPVNVIQNDMAGKYIFVVENIEGKMVAKKRTIKEGEEYSGMVEIIDGLKAGDKIITTGYQNLEDGTLIKM